MHYKKSTQELDLETEGFELAGNFSVDAGICLIGDPCYYLHKEDKFPTNSLGKDWGDFCDKLEEGEFNKTRFKSFNHKMGHEGLGVLVSTGYGDGVYPVYVKKSDEGRIAEVRIIFIDESPNDEDNA